MNRESQEIASDIANAVLAFFTMTACAAGVGAMCVFVAWATWQAVNG